MKYFTDVPYMLITTYLYSVHLSFHQYYYQEILRYVHVLIVLIQINARKLLICLGLKLINSILPCLSLSMLEFTLMSPMWN